MGFLFAGLFGVVTAGELSETSRLLEFQRDFESAGGYVAIASAPDGLSFGRCEDLKDNSAVVAAGGVRPESPVEVRHVPGRLFATASITPGLLDVWAPTRDRSETTGWYVGPSAAKELGRAGTHIQAGSRPPAPITPVNLTLRNPEADRWLLDVAPPVGSGTNCWVEFRPGHLAAGMNLLAVTFADVEGVSIREHVRLDQFAFDPVAALEDRPLRNAWTALGAASAILTALTAWTRRGEISLYRALGLGRARVVLLYTTEAAILVVSSALVGAIWATVVIEMLALPRLTNDQLLIAYRTAASGLLLGLATFPGVILPFSRLNIAEQLKDR